MSNPYASQAVDLSQIARDGEGVSELTIEALRGTKKWARLVGVILLIGAPITALHGVAIMFGLDRTISTEASGASGIMIGRGALNLLIACGYGVLGFYLVKFASAISQLLEDGQVSSLETALQNQQKFWCLAGWLTVASLIFIVFVFSAVFVIPSMMR